MGWNYVPSNEYANIINVIKVGGGLVAGAPQEPIEVYKGWNLMLIFKNQDTSLKVLQALSDLFHHQMVVYVINSQCVDSEVKL